MNNISNLDINKRFEILEKNPDMIAFIDKPTYHEQAFAVMSNPYLIRCIENPFPEVIKYCAKYDFQSILYLNIPEETELYILETNTEYLEYVAKPWKPHIIEWVIKHQIFCFPFDEIDVTPELTEKSVKYNLRNAMYFKYIDPELQRYMLLTDIKSIKCIKNLNNEVLMEFIDSVLEENSYAIIQSEETCEDAKVFLRMKFGDKPPRQAEDVAFYYCPYIPLQMSGPFVNPNTLQPVAYQTRYTTTHIPLI